MQALIHSKRVGAALCALLAICHPVACGSPAGEGVRHPILFVHGRGQDGSIFEPMIRFFTQQGWPREHLLVIDLVPNTGPNARAAEEQIAPFVERALAAINHARGAQGRSAFAKLDLVTYSMGSVSGRWYAARVRPDRVRTWVSLAGANHGTDIGCPQPEGSGSAELCPAFAATARQSAVQFALNGTSRPDVDETPYGLGADHARVARVPPDAARSILYLTVRLPADDYIGPVTSTVLDGAGGEASALHDPRAMRETSPGNFLLLTPSDHEAILESPQVLEFLLRTFTTRPPRE